MNVVIDTETFYGLLIVIYFIFILFFLYITKLETKEFGNYVKVKPILERLKNE